MTKQISYHVVNYLHPSTVLDDALRQNSDLTIPTPCRLSCAFSGRIIRIA